MSRRLGNEKECCKTASGFSISLREIEYERKRHKQSTMMRLAFSR